MEYHFLEQCAARQKAAAAAAAASSSSASVDNDDNNATGQSQVEKTAASNGSAMPGTDGTINRCRRRDCRRPTCVRRRTLHHPPSTVGGTDAIHLMIMAHIVSYCYESVVVSARQRYGYGLSYLYHFGTLECIVFIFVGGYHHGIPMYAKCQDHWNFQFQINCGLSQHIAFPCKWCCRYVSSFCWVH